VRQDLQPWEVAIAEARITLARRYAGMGCDRALARLQAWHFWMWGRHVLMPIETSTDPGWVQLHQISHVRDL
jgi:hypothetical protein